MTTPTPTLDLDALIDRLCDLRILHGGRLPIAYALDSEGNYACYAAEIRAERLVPTATIDGETGELLLRVLPELEAAPGEVPALVLWPTMAPELTAEREAIK